MATRLYLHTDIPPAVVPAVDAYWQETGNASIGVATPNRRNSAFVAKAITQNPANTGGEFALFYQFVTPPFAAILFPLMGTVKMQLRAMQSNASADMYGQVFIRLLTSDGTTLIRKLIDDGVNTVFETALTNNYFIVPDTAVTPSVVQIGYILSIEIGMFASWLGTPYTATIEFGDAAATDLPEDESTTDQDNPWIEFSEDLSFSPVSSVVRSYPVHTIGNVWR